MLTLGGIVPYFGRALALSGYLAPMGQDGQQGDADLSFFIGGAWDSPFAAQVGPTVDFE
ncbi:hypothetical protein [Neoaquamicrobium sediminum]|uniref:hypothetical protein n=1 Tax=Neoaquamicrobium sediminum TaxID=1849104 RepID=UPI0015637B00|nr:hypothetical protein [Mesorhizobium sediminum]NRC52685.1 hypothetical protein [Mesorhizobium sediminum]